MKTVVVLLLLSLAAKAQTTREWHINVNLEVSAAEPLHARIVSFCSRELRSIKGIDVISSDDHADYKISIVALATSTLAVMSIVVSSPMKPIVPPLEKQLEKEVARERSNPDSGDMLNYTLLHLLAAEEPLHHMLRTNSIDKIDEMCKELIADVDGQTFDSNRKLFAGRK